LDFGARVHDAFRGADLPGLPLAPRLGADGIQHLAEAAAYRLLGVPGPPGERRVAGGPALARLNAPFPTEILAQASTEWERGIPKRSAMERAALNGDMEHTIRVVQSTFAEKGDGQIRRGQHAKGVLAVTNAQLSVKADLPKELQVGPFQAGASLRTLIRFSNAPSSVQADGASQRRGIALRFTDDKGHSQDLLMTTGSPAFLAKDGPAAVAAAKAEASGALGLAGLVGHSGLGDTARLLLAAKTTENHDQSLASATFFSRVPYQLGDYAAKFRLVPVETDGAIRGGGGPDQLTSDATARLSKGDVVYVLEAQFNRNPADMADARVDWDSAYVPLGKVVIPRQDLSNGGAQKAIETMDGLSFSPWNRWDDKDDRAMRPVGDVNEARKAIYTASSENRGSGGVNNHKCPMGYG